MKNILKSSLCMFFVTVTFLSGFVMAEPININTASKEEIIANLKGIGAAKADAIIIFREKNGSFSKPEDLIKIVGIGEKTLEKFKADLRFGDEKATESESAK